MNKHFNFFTILMFFTMQAFAMYQPRSPNLADKFDKFIDKIAAAIGACRPADRRQLINDSSDEESAFFNNPRIGHNPLIVNPLTVAMPGQKNELKNQLGPQCGQGLVSDADSSAPETPKNSEKSPIEEIISGNPLRQLTDEDLKKFDDTIKKNFKLPKDNSSSSWVDLLAAEEGSKKL